MLQNEFLCGKTAICTRLQAIYSKTKCVLVLNAMRLGAKYNVFWC